MRPYLKTLVLAVIIIVLPSVAHGFDPTGWGGNILYHDGLGAQLRKDLWTDEETFLLNGQFGFLLQNDEDRAFIDLDLHILVTASDFDNPRVYPLAGFHVELAGERLGYGVNLGIGVAVMTSDIMAVFAEVKYTAVMEHHDAGEEKDQGAWLAVGLRY